MDLRPYIKNSSQLKAGISLIKKNCLLYQPFIIADDIEVGEGQNHADCYKNNGTVFDFNTYALNHDIGDRKQAPDLEYFRKCNDEYRQIYNHYANVICKQFNNEISNLSFAEIGCNTGLNLFNLAQRGAGSCTGYDWNNMSEVFSWLNDILKTRVKFRQGVYDNLYHRFKGFDVPEVDVMINTIYTNHQCDPLQFLTYICDRARVCVFLVALTAKDDKCAVYYPETPPHKILDTSNRFPLYFNNGVLLSEKLLMLSFSQLGFSDVQIVEKFIPDKKWDNYQSAFTIYCAKRTSERKSAYEAIGKRNLFMSSIINKLFSK